jgi:hypothetical protein
MLREAKSLAGRFQSLRRKHQKLETEIEQEAARPVPDSLRLRTLKALKLKTRDQMQRIHTMLRPSGRVRVAHPI